MIIRASFWLSYQDSNLDKQNQKLLCYHYTIRQSHGHQSDDGSNRADSVSAAKLPLFFETRKSQKSDGSDAEIGRARRVRLL